MRIEDYKKAKKLRAKIKENSDCQRLLNSFKGHPIYIGYTEDVIFLDGKTSKKVINIVEDYIINLQYKNLEDFSKL